MSTLMQCGAINGDFTCSRLYGHEEDHAYHHASGGIVTWRAASPVPVGPTHAMRDYCSKLSEDGKDCCRLDVQHDGPCAFTGIPNAPFAPSLGCGEVLLSVPPVPVGTTAPMDGWCEVEGVGDDDLRCLTHGVTFPRTMIPVSCNGTSWATPKALARARERLAGPSSSTTAPPAPTERCENCGLTPVMHYTAKDGELHCWNHEAGRLTGRHYRVKSPLVPPAAPTSETADRPPRYKSNVTEDTRAVTESTTQGECRDAKCVALNALVAEFNELYPDLAQLINGWKAGSMPGEWSTWDESMRAAIVAFAKKARDAAASPAPADTPPAKCEGGVVGCTLGCHGPFCAAPSQPSEPTANHDCPDCNRLRDSALDEAAAAMHRLAAVTAELHEARKVIVRYHMNRNVSRDTCLCVYCVANRAAPTTEPTNA